MSAGDLVSGEISAHTALPLTLIGKQGTAIWSGDEIVATIHGTRDNHRVARARAEFIVRACNAHDALAKAVQAEFALVCMPIREGEELSKQIGWNGKEDRNIFCRRLRYAAIAALAK